VEDKFGNVYGPFDTAREAEQWSARHSNGMWGVAALRSPDEL
jgi:hypothetical protein